MSGCRAIGDAATTGTKADVSCSCNNRQSTLALPISAKLHPVAQLIGVDAVRQCQMGNRYAGLHCSVDQPVFLDGIETPLPVGKNLHSPKAP